VGNDDFSPMNEVTGGRVPAPIWKRLHEVADRGKQPMSVAGIPLDGTYQRVAAIDPLPAQVIPQTTDETPDISTDTAAEAPDDVKNVLDGMFNLFEKPERQASVRKVAAGRVSKVKSAARPNRVPRNTSLQPEQAAGRKKSNFLEKLFRPRKRVEKKKEKKGLFGF
jgi:penicillin-binding protein 1A